jgi:hypothetical protein
VHPGRQAFERVRPDSAPLPGDRIWILTWGRRAASATRQPPNGRRLGESSRAITFVSSGVAAESDSSVRALRTAHGTRSRAAAIHKTS